MARHYILLVVISCYYFNSNENIKEIKITFSYFVIHFAVTLPFNYIVTHSSHSSPLNKLHRLQYPLAELVWTDTVVTGNKIDWPSVTRQRAIICETSSERVYDMKIAVEIKLLYKLGLAIQKTNQNFKNSKILNENSFLRARVQMTIIIIISIVLNKFSSFLFHFNYLNSISINVKQFLTFNICMAVCSQQNSDIQLSKELIIIWCEV